MDIAEEESKTDEGSCPVELCIHCVKPVGINANFCVHCRAPLNFIASTIPFLTVFAEGWILRTGVTEPKSRTTVLGIWLIFLHYIGTGYILYRGMFFSWRDIYAHWTHLFYFGVSAGMILIGLVAITRCTMNYLAWSKKAKQKE